MKFGQIPFDLICRFGEISQNEIRVVSYLYACRNQKTGLCNPSRKTISTDTKIEKGNLSKAIAGLEDKKWITENQDGTFTLFSSNQIPEKVVELTTFKIKNEGKKVVSSTTKVVSSTTENCRTHNSHNNELNRERTENKHTPPVRGNGQSPPNGNGHPPNSKVVIPATAALSKTPISAKSDFNKIFFDGLDERKLCTPFDRQKWQVTADHLFQQSNASAELALASIDWLKTDSSQDWRKGRITAEVVASNFGLFLEKYKPPAKQIDSSKCPDCHGSEMIIIDVNTAKICKHEKLST